jgi:hypothetical protein
MLYWPLIVGPQMRLGTLTLFVFELLINHFFLLLGCSVSTEILQPALPAVHKGYFSKDLFPE